MMCFALCERVCVSGGGGGDERERMIFSFTCYKCSLTIRLFEILQIANNLVYYFQRSWLDWVLLGK